MSRTLLDHLTAQFPAAKRQTLKHMVQAGRVSINGRPAAMLKQELAEKDRVIVDDHATRAPAPPPPDLRIVYEDEDLLVLDKAAGLLTSTVPNEKRPTLWALARAYVAQRGGEPRARVGLIHRLDRDASGVLIFSKTDLAYQSLKTQFFQHTVRREYAAVVHGTPRPPRDRIESHLVERADGTVHSTKQIGKGQLAVTDYEVLETRDKRSLLRVILQTGRKHQIRVHLSERNLPIVGDRVYGRPDDPSPRLMLAAAKLTIRHPRDGREVVFTGPGIDLTQRR